jgi:uncharacterized protein (DUF4415 family)
MSKGKLVVTKKDFEEMKAQGINDESLLTPGNYKLHRRTKIATREELQPANTKVQITIKIDLDVLNYFKKRASEPNSAPYQTQINNELRAIMENSEKTETESKNINDAFQNLLSNKKFIKALAKEVKKVA